MGVLLFPVDVIELLRKRLDQSKRPNDGLLHASSHLVSPLRHAMLDVAGAPKIRRPVTDDVRLETGTRWHSDFESIFRANRLPVMSEVNLTPYLPEGWSGTADWMFWSDEYKAFVLGDLKTIKGDGIKWLHGPKDAHLWQLSAYWHALVEMGIPLVRGFGVLYLPMNQTYPEPVEPVIMEADPLPWSILGEVMAQRWHDTQLYLRTDPGQPGFEAWVNDYLAPVEPRVQKVSWNSKLGVFDVKLAPDWYSMFCDYPDELCDCNRQPTEKIGHYLLDETYITRDGYELFPPEVRPTDADYRKRRK